jgi:hypothetical protein
MRDLLEQVSATRSYGAVHSALSSDDASATKSENPTEMAQGPYPSAGAGARGRQVSGATNHRLDTDRTVGSLCRPAGQVAPQQQGALLRSVIGVPDEPQNVFAIDDRDLVATRHQCADGCPVVGSKCACLSSIAVI